jgi:hypothetical protein
MKRPTTPILFALASWAGLAIVLFGQDRSRGMDSNRLTICRHETRGSTRNLNLAQVRETYSQIERRFKELIQAKAADVITTPRLTFTFDSRLRRGDVSRRTITLAKPLPQPFVGTEFILGELSDFEPASDRPGRRVNLLVRVVKPEDLVKANATIPNIALATPDIIKLFELDLYPARILLKDAQHVTIAPLK